MTALLHRIFKSKSETSPWHAYASSSGKLVREEIAGTGMYEGLVTTGITKEVEPPKEIQPGVTTFCNQGTGTYKMK